MSEPRWGWTETSLWLLCLWAAFLGGSSPRVAWADEFGRRGQICYVSPKPEPVRIPARAFTLEVRVDEALNRHLPLPGDWSTGLTIAEQADRTICRFEYPADLVSQYRVSADFAPGFLPEQFPDKTVAEMCGADLLESWQLASDQGRNPFAIASDEVQAMNSNDSYRMQKLGWAAAYAWTHRHVPDAGNGATDALLSDLKYARQDVLLSLAGPAVLAKIPATLTKVAHGEGEVSVDLRLTVGFAHDSVASIEDTLLTAAQRGVGAIALTGRGEIEQSLVAQRVAETLIHQGRLPRDFRVITSEYIQTTGGSVVGLFLKDRILEGQTLRQTVDDIHAQGGLAYLARPGDIGAAPALRRLPFDGYLVEPGNFQLFRTLKLINDPLYGDKVALYASNSRYAVGAGLPYSNVPLKAGAADPLQAGMAAHEAYAAGPLYLPWMLLLLSRPPVDYQKALNTYFALNDALALRLEQILKADQIIVRTSWDDEVRDMMGLAGAVPAWRKVFNGSSPLLGFPRLNSIEIEYGRVSVTYDQALNTWLVSSRFRW